MTYVDPGRIELVLAWDRCIISLSPEDVSKMDEIGATPPDLYGNGAQRRVTPCSVETVTGEIFDPAMIWIQRDAPVQTYSNFRLGSEIAHVNESRFSLPLEVRLASSRAEERRMGFSPFLIEMPDGRRFVLNGMTSFFANDGYDAREAKTAAGDFFSEDPQPSSGNTRLDVTCFIVDGDPGWIREKKM